MAAADGVEIASATGTQPPACRGPPRSARKPAGLGGLAPCASADEALVVRDNLGHPVPVCAAEVDAIETYLGTILDELFASSKAGSEPDRA